MPSLRQDVATRIWSIIAAERAKRPDDFKQAGKMPEKAEAHDPGCPFCPGNESMTPEAVYSIPHDNEADGWRVRVVPNKFAALSSPEPGSDPRRIQNGLYLEMCGCGAHEVIIEVPDHSKTIATMSEEEVEQVVRTYRERFLELDRSVWHQLIIIFRNQGKRAGTSLEHPHSQIIGTPVVPEEIRRRLEEAQRYHDDHGTCVYCDVIQHELAEEVRLVCSNSGFVALCPFASTVPYEMWILPRRHASSFGVLTDEEAGLLAKLLKEALHRLYDLLDNPDYNYVVRSAPHHSAGEPHFHWYVEILPRLTTRAGFEIGSGMNINVVAPESAAESLRGAG
jgi:UDPglucose--hexose-1-phosphate uridylyltransferase